MSNFLIFIVGMVVTLIAGMGVITSQVFIGYNKKQPVEEIEKEVEIYAIDKSA